MFAAIVRKVKTRSLLGGLLADNVRSRETTAVAIASQNACRGGISTEVAPSSRIFNSRDGRRCGQGYVMLHR